MATVAELVERSRIAYEGLALVAEEVADEWQYITDLRAAWLAELDRVALDEGSRAATSPVAAAIDRLIEEVERISDPHRAIDWLSTFPQAVLLALAGQ